MNNYAYLAHAGFYDEPNLPAHMTRVVVDAMTERKIHVRDLAMKIYQDPGHQSFTGAERLIGRIRKFHFEMFPSPVLGSIKCPNKAIAQLHRLSIVLSALEIPPNDPIISRMKHVYHGYFSYPPKIDR